MSRRTGTVVAAVALWLAIVASTSTAAWVVIDGAGGSIYLTDGPMPDTTRTGPGAKPVPTTDATSPPTVATPSRGTSAGTIPTHTAGPPRSTPTSRTPTVRATTTTTTAARPTPTTAPGRSDQGTPSTTPGRPDAVNDSVSVTGGSLGVSCRGTALTLRYATPQNGWSYTIGRATSQIEVTFRQNGGATESDVHARCSGGAPAFETSSSGGDEGDDDVGT